MLKRLGFVLLTCTGTLALLVSAGLLFQQFAPVFGASPEGDSLQKAQASHNYQNGKFVNLVPTALSTQDPNAGSAMASMLFPPTGKNPMGPLQNVKFDQSRLVENSIVWFGHSSFLLQQQGLRILLDPVFHAASPLPIFGKPFATANANTIDDLPQIDIVLITHDHYDHLDYRSIKQLENSNNPNGIIYAVPLGVDAHLMRWGVPAERIHSMDWHDQLPIDTVTFTLVPSRHFSGRGLFNRDSTLWGGWIMQSDSSNLYFSGDTGYFSEFAATGARYGPFDIAFMENGAYSTLWANIHLMPEESVQASIDLEAAHYVPVHWGKFDLSTHPWREPVERAEKAASALSVSMFTPLRGEIFTLETLSNPDRGSDWWRRQALE